MTQADLEARAREVLADTVVALLDEGKREDAIGLAVGHEAAIRAILAHVEKYRVSNPARNKYTTCQIETAIRLARAKAFKEAAEVARGAATDIQPTSEGAACWVVATGFVATAIEALGEKG